eukprot:1147899-Pelagomonas_calceolata.AAC.3
MLRPIRFLGAGMLGPKESGIPCTFGTFLHWHDAQKHSRFLFFGVEVRHFAAVKCIQSTCGSAEPDGIDWSVGHRHFPEQCLKKGQGGNVVKTRVFQAKPSCQNYLKGSVCGPAGPGWARTSGGVVCSGQSVYMQHTPCDLFGIACCWRCPSFVFLYTLRTLALCSVVKHSCVAALDPAAGSGMQWLQSGRSACGVSGMSMSTPSSEGGTHGPSLHCMRAQGRRWVLL